MRRVEYSEKAADNLRDLARDCQDPVLVAELEEQIRTIAEFPDLAEPAKFPHAGGHMWSGHLLDATGRLWGFTVLLFIVDQPLPVLVVRLIRFGRAPLHYND